MLEQLDLPGCTPSGPMITIDQTLPWQVVVGDCIDAVATLPDASVHSVVTDPPAGVSFMSADWDGNKGGRAAWVTWLARVMRECLRVLKPGGYAVVWALPRTSHWTATAIEDAGFEIRDVITHHYGSGFPKSLDVSQSIEKQQTTGRTRADRVLGRGRIEGAGPGACGNYDSGGKIPVTTAAAKHWVGFGTALKPASEHWILARKPLIGTVADNVLAHGTGALNIDACRVATTENLNGSAGEYQQPIGRWPANLILSHAEQCVEGQCVEGCPTTELDQQGGGSKTGRRSEQSRDAEVADTKFGNRNHRSKEYPEDTGTGASRFFYVAKPSRREREAGLDAFEPTPKNAVYGAGLNSATKIRTTEQATHGVDRGATKNSHPTVKPIALMRLLVRLITPPDGVVLDCFAGSGSTGCAAVLEGRRFVGIDSEPTYVDIARARIAHWAGSPAPAKPSVTPAPHPLVPIGAPVACETVTTPAQKPDPAAAAAPILKWAGAKNWLAPRIVPVIQAHLASTGGRYIEPFLGSGAIGFRVGAKNMILSDVLQPLIECYQTIRRSPSAVAWALSTLVERGLDEAAYYRVRDDQPRAPVARAARFIYLNKKNYNGLWRESASGVYNVPYGGERKNVAFPDVAELSTLASVLASATLLTSDALPVIEAALPGDLIVADPPYDGPKSFKSYAAGGFGPGHQTALAAALRRAAERGVAIIATNADTPLVRQLYGSWTMIETTAEKRMINSDGKGRSAVPCVLMSAGIRV